MKRMVKLVALTTALVMTAAAVSGCGSQSAGNSDVATQEKSTEAGTESGTKQAAEGDLSARYDEPVEISSVKNLGAGMQFPEGDSLEDNVWTR